jgi:MoaA/NifB/PqqE/SkfB family radical SAM enzyme
MLTPDLIAELNRATGLPPGSSACPAASINLHFSQLGVVTACCFNRQHVLGIYPQNSVAEIWTAKPIQDLRDALARHDLSKGCEKCQQQIEARDFGGSHAVFYSNYATITGIKRKELGLEPPGDPARNPMPMRLEFNIHNSCNLQCIMCHGLASSAIRTQREGLPAMANPYDDAFVDQLTPFFPYVVETDFMGGEPFLIPVYIKLWERIAETNPKMQVVILTNGTLLTDRTKELLERINCWMHVSIDSVFKQTYESIRRGANYDDVMAHCTYYVELMKKRGRSVIFRYCPMRVNWREIPDTVRFCNDRGIKLMYNQVDSPINLSLHTLATPELQTVVNYLGRNAPKGSTTDDVSLHNEQQYNELVQRLEGFLDGKNRVNILRARLSVSDAVVGQYTRERREASSTRIPGLEEVTNTLIQAAKRYLTTRLNVDQAEETESELPDDVLAAVAGRRADMQELLPETDEKLFVKVFLNELVRTYSGVGGVLRPHGLDVFDKVEEFATDVALQANRHQVIRELLEARPAEVYDALLSYSAAELKRLFNGEGRSGDLVISVKRSTATPHAAGGPGAAQGN